MDPREDLSKTAQLYVGIVILAGVLAVVHSLHSLLTSTVSYHWFVLAGLTLLSGSFTVRVPTIPARLSVSETFVFAAVLLFGPAAATVIVILDTLVISLWLDQRSRRPFRFLFNMAAPAVAIWIAAHAFYWLADVPPLAQVPRPIFSLLGPLLALAVLYFLLNSLLIAFAVAFEKGTSGLRIWRQNLLWLSLNYFSGASVAALLLPYLQPGQSQFIPVIGVLVPLLLISYLTFKTALGRVDDANRHLSQLNSLYLSTIETLAMAIDAKDQITHGHIRRVQAYAVGLARAMGVTDSAQIQAIEAAALLHDMGKLAVPEYILNKPGPLTPAEFDKMKLHASVGADILSAIEFPYPVVPIVRHHHENWDGSGYPDGLVGADIPIGARILSVVDCFDALTSDRPYRPRLTDRDALRILLDRRGRMYDPIVVDAFTRVHADLAPLVVVHGPAAPLSAITDAALPLKQRALAGTNRFEKITASGEEMLALFELARGLTGNMTLSDVGDVILKHLRRMIPSSLSVIYVYDQDTDELVCSYASGEHCAFVAGLRIQLGQRLSGWVGANRQTIRNSDPVLDLGESARVMTPRLCTCLSTPLVAHDNLIGVLSLYSATKDVYTEDHQRVAEVVGRQVAPVVLHAMDSDRTSRVSYHDKLTGLPTLEQLRSKQKNQSVDYARNVSVILIDVPELKSVNDQHGSVVGDRVLKSVATCLVAISQIDGKAFRSGGTEFLLVLADTDSRLAMSRASALADSIAARISNDTPIKVGVASMPEDGDSVEQLISRARGRATVQFSSGAEGSTRSPDSIH